MKKEVIQSFNPATGNLLWEGIAADNKEVTRAVKRASEAFSDWRKLGFQSRFEILKRFQKRLLEQKSSFAKMISEENGKPLWEAETEVEAALAKIDLSKDAYNDRSGEKESDEKIARLYTRFHPHGSIAVLGPFNFPLHLPLGHIAPALLAGNTIIFKPSEKTPRIGEKLTELLHECGVPSGALNLIQGGRDTGWALATNKNISGLYFTGSYGAGLALSRYFGKYPEKILALEMGGNNPLVFLDAKHPEAAALIAVQSCFLSTGQRCTAARRLIVVRSGKEKPFLDAFLHMTKNLRIGAFDENPQPFAGPLISPEAAQHVLDTQRMLIERGATALLPLKTLPQGPSFLSAGILDVTLCKQRPPDEECFGPLVQVIFVKNFAMAIKEANRTAFGLSASLISENPHAWEQFSQEIRAGIINWNMPTTGASSKAPFGGIGKSGNYRPSAFFAADYCSYPVASFEKNQLLPPTNYPPGISYP